MPSIEQQGVYLCTVIQYLTLLLFCAMSVWSPVTRRGPYKFAIKRAGGGRYGTKFSKDRQNRMRAEEKIILYVGVREKNKKLEKK